MLTVKTFANIIKSSIVNPCSSKKKFVTQICSFSTSANNDKVDNQRLLGEIGAKYKVFDDKDAEIIFDVFEEKLKYQHLLEERIEEEEDRFKGINLARGRFGVFDIEDLVEVLKKENGTNIFVAKVPAQIKYVDYLCIVNGKSQKHMQAIVQFVRRVYKQKKEVCDIVPRTEGEKSQEWIALDLGNIALHVFSKEARELYDLDTLWAVGPQYDDETNKPEPISDMLEKHTIFLSGLEPAS